MRSDLDRLMRDRGLAGLVVLALDRYCPAMYYVTGQKIHHGIWFRSADGRTHLVHDPMERDQAALAGCEASSYSTHGFLAMVKSGGSQASAFAQLTAKMCRELGIRGRIAFAGETPLAWGWSLQAAMREHAPELELDLALPDVLSEAAATKDEPELEKIRHASSGAVEAMHRVRGYLAALKRDGDAFRDASGERATLGRIRGVIHEAFTAFGLQEDGESIVSQGRDAGVPHNRGNDADLVREGAPILIDIFPGEAGGGYHTDMTRTFCVGTAPEPLRTIYTQCKQAFDAAMHDLHVGTPCRSYQDLVCAIFEKQGHPTLRTHEGTEEGYVHSLGHGVGLAVHEGPRLGGPASNTTLLAPGHVVSVEPGLYYPARAMGVRIEDLVAVRADGSIENLTPAPYDLEVPLRA